MRAILLVASVFAFIVTVSAASDTSLAAWSAQVSGLREPGVVFLTGVVLLALAYAARQLLRKNGPRSAS